MDKKILIIGIVVILVLIVAVAAFAGNKKTIDPKTDIVLDGDLSGEWNGPAGEWLVTGNTKSVSNTDYSNIQIQLTAYDASNNIVGVKNTTISDMSNGYSGYIQTVMKVTGQPDHVNMTVLNATIKS